MRDIIDDDFTSVAKNPRQRTSAENRKRKEAGQPEIPYEADEAYLHAVWRDQQGCCNICGIEMDLIGEAHVASHANMLRVSVDCINPEQWYLKGNIALVHFVCNSFKNSLDPHTLFAIASGILRRFQEMYPGVEVEIDKNLVSRDGAKFFHYPKFSYTSNGNGVLTDAGRDYFRTLMSESGEEVKPKPEPPQGDGLGAKGL